MPNSVSGARIPSLGGRVLQPFQRLRWKLTITYTLFTAAGILILQSLGLVVALSMPRNRLPNILVKRFAGRLIGPDSQVASYLAHSPPDRDALENWLHHQLGRDLDSFDPKKRESPPDRRPLSGAVLGPDGSMLASWPGGETIASAVQSSRGAEILRQTLRGRDSPATILRVPGGGEFFAAPIYGGDHRILGALAMIIPGPAGLGGFLRGLLSWRNAALITMVACLIGAVFGFLTAGWLTRRLQRFAVATDAWGRGEFAVRIRENSADELGQLAERFNGMADQLHGLLQARESLAVMEERTRLARDLHDSVTQSIFGITLHATAAAKRFDAGDGDAAREDLRAVISAADLTLREMRLLIYELRPVELEKQGLATALRRRLEAVEEKAGLNTELTVEGEGGIPPQIEEELYRIAQEALNNILKHARAERISVVLRLRDTVVELEIADDGRGFQPAVGENGGFGLKGMRERVARLGGAMRIGGQPGSGTIIRVEVPRS